MSDHWPAYNNIPNLVDSDGVSLNYEHHTINHSAEFVNDWVHTQTVKRFRCDLNGNCKKEGGLIKESINTCTDYFLLKNIRKARYTT